jgi:hypothetical protein
MNLAEWLAKLVTMLQKSFGLGKKQILPFDLKKRNII